MIDGLGKMTTNVVKNWFEDDFKLLAPQIQTLHTAGGTLAGEVFVRYGQGIAGLIGKKLGRKLGIPGEGRHRLVVTVAHRNECLQWDRLFNDKQEMKSVFTPVGTIDGGYWVEKTGPLHIKLTVDIHNGGWYWRCLSYSFWGIPLPVVLFPPSEAYKRIEDGQYRFYVGFKLWFFGDVLSYGGLLDVDA